MPLVLTSRPTRKSGGRKVESKKFLKANPCCDQRSCHAGKRESEVNVLAAKEPSGAICTIAEDEWVEIEVAVDSGATETVMGEEPLSGIVDITEGPACRGGVTYEVADGTEIPNLGRESFWVSPNKEDRGGGHSPGLCGEHNAYERYQGCRPRQSSDLRRRWKSHRRQTWVSRKGRRVFEGPDSKSDRIQ